MPRDVDTKCTIRNGMSVDVEDYYQVSAFEQVVGRARWSSYAPRVEHNTHRILDLFDAAGVTATFFVLGWVAERHPELVRRIVASGHELASHGYEHRRARDQTPSLFFDDVTRTKRLLEDIGGVEVKGYRAASFSIDLQTWWTFDGLARAGYRYSSSVNPIRHDHYGQPDAPRHPFRPIEREFTEIPISTVDLCGRRWACGGGGFFRLLPYRWSHWAISRLNRVERRPAVFYFHPWEIDPDQPRIDGASRVSRLRHYARLGAMEAKVRRILKDFAWERLDRVFLDASAHRLSTWPGPVALGT
jgi:peptidoglycan-N-acetylglucosamine deacetylase